MTPIIIASWVIASLLIATAGRNYRFHFWGYFFASMLLTPVIGLLLLLAAVPPRGPRGGSQVSQKEMRP